MLYDNVHYLGEMFQHFLLDNRELLHNRVTCPSVSQRSAVHDTEIPLHQRLETWLDTATTLVHPTHRATLRQLADTYETLLKLHDTSHMYPTLSRVVEHFLA